MLILHDAYCLKSAWPPNKLNNAFPSNYLGEYQCRFNLQKGRFGDEEDVPLMMGPPGLPGPKGETGEMGPRAEKGDKGDQGLYGMLRFFPFFHILMAHFQVKREIWEHEDLLGSMVLMEKLDRKDLLVSQ
jgi:hypothetical protein